VGQAARLLGLNPDVRDLVNPAGIRRWAYGYERQGRAYAAAIRVEQFSRKTETLSFLELVEVMFVISSLTGGASWPKVRNAISLAAKVLPNDPHPFANRRWFVDPAGIYLELGTESDEPVLLEMAGDIQVTMKDVLKGYLQQVRFNELTGVADSWYPLGFQTPIVVDPRYSFGQPIVASSGVRTEILFGHSRAGDKPETIAAWYGVPQYEVEAAIEFEEKLQPKAA
jgi:uncharacterized protein (DUF433 family)